MRGIPTQAVTVASVLAMVGQATAQTITAANGNATFTFNSTAVPTNATGIGGGSSNLDVNGTTAGGDSLFETWWWYRVDGVDSREFRYSADTNPFVASGDTMTGTFNFTEFRSDLRYQVIDNDGGGSGGARVTLRNTIVNTSALARTINIFSYADLDVNGEVGGNTYSYNHSAGHFQVTDAAPTNTTAYFKGMGATAYQAAIYTTTPGNGVRGLVADADIDNLNNTVTGSPGDFTGAFQWTFTLNPGEMYQILGELNVNPPSWPTPGTVFLFGVAGIGVMRRKKGTA